MVKFQGLTSSLKDLVEQMDAAQQFEIAPLEEGAEKNEALVNIVTEFEKGEDILTCWTNATRMRRWLMSKKQSIAQKLEYASDKSKTDSEILQEIIQKVVLKAEFLSVLQNPNAVFKSDADNGESEPNM